MAEGEAIGGIWPFYRSKYVYDSLMLNWEELYINLSGAFRAQQIVFNDNVCPCKLLV